MNCGWPIAPAHDPRMLRQVDVAAVEDLERVEQLAAEERRRGADPRRASRAPATVGRTPLKRPKFDSMPQIADDDPRRHAVALADLLEQLALCARTPRGPSRIALRRQHARDVRLEREDRFGLRAIALEDDRQRLVDVGRAPASTTLLADAARERFGADAGEPFGKRRPRRCPGRARAQRQRDQHDSSARDQRTHEAPAECSTADTRVAPTTNRCTRRCDSASVRGRRPAPPRLGRFISSTSGISARNMTPSSWKMPDERHHRRLPLHHAEERGVGAVGRGRRRRRRPP